jgi:nicotinate-nucleotide--dimethylbenzimidazole phosphoribosyltransferase
MSCDASLEQRVRARLDNLTKPPGSLGRLEDAVVRLACIQGTDRPSVARKGMYVFCANHGVTAEGVSPYPSEVTRQMMANFQAGGAAINVLCRREGIETVIVDAGVDPGTRNFAAEPAMGAEDADRVLALGMRCAEEAASRFDVAGLGEMGIGNTTCASAILSAITGTDPAETAGAGTGLDAVRVGWKADVIRKALRLHQPDPADGRAVLRAVGGYEVGAIAGFLIRASQLRLAVVLDGFPCCAAALIARSIDPGALDTALFGHRSAERGHGRMLEALGAAPYLDLGMRLGEGTGAALAMGVLDAAVRLYDEMATFSQAQVSIGQ